MPGVMTAFPRKPQPPAYGREHMPSHEPPRRGLTLASRFPNAAFLILTLGAALAALPVRGEAPAPTPPVPPPVAAWDVVPHQVIRETLCAGVVAFHRSALTVEFRVQASGAAVPAWSRTVTEPTLNPQVNVWEYWCSIDPATLPDGAFSVQARVFPTGHPEAVKELAPLPLFANAKGTLPPGREVIVDAAHGDDAQPGDAGKPLRTLKAGLAAAGVGGRVLLRPGSYSAQALGGGMKRAYWTTVTAAPGISADAVEITPGRPGTDKLRFAGVTLAADPAEKGYNTILAGEQGKSEVWLDGCRIVCKKGRESGTDFSGNVYPAYITGGETMDLANGPAARLMRGHRIRRICSDAFTSVAVAVNCTVDEIDRGGTAAHPDFCQSHVASPDQYKSFILYNCRGLRCSSQGFFGLNLRDSAFVNCLFVKYPPNSPMLSQYSGRMENVLFLHLTLPNQAWNWRGKGALTRDVWFLNSIVPAMSAGDPAWLAGIRVADTHFILGAKPYGAQLLGDQATQGAAAFADPAAGDYRLLPDSPAAGTAQRLPCVPADIDGTPWPAGKANRGCLRTRD